MSIGLERFVLGIPFDAPMFAPPPPAPAEPPDSPVAVSCSSSIGRNSDCSAGGVDDDADGEVQISYKGPLDTMDALEDSLPINCWQLSLFSFMAAMAIMGCRGDFPLALRTPSLGGLALSDAAPMVSLLSNFLTSFTETEKEMVSVERVLQYMDIPQEELQGSQYMPPDWLLQGDIEFEHVTLKYKPSLPAALNNLSFKIATGMQYMDIPQEELQGSQYMPSDWLLQGDIEFEHVTLKYKPSLPAALNNHSFKIATGMQVGIVGRTGVGISSIINALFRLTPIFSGRILVDGVDVAGFSVGDLRRHLAVVPQSPFLFEGSLRENLDPYANTSGAKIWEALEKCYVKSDVESSGGLNVRVKEGGISFSVGQRQLICLARALIKSSKTQLVEYVTIEKYYLERKVYVEEVLIGGASVYYGRQDGNSLMEGFTDGGYLIWLEARLQKLS